jgi:UDP:flavonoid glycosyltransferase YjiC (YdhE family)
VCGSFNLLRAQKISNNVFLIVVLDVCGFFFRDPPEYQPPPDLSEFLLRGDPPVYIGFGSIVIDEPDKMTATLLEAIEAAGVRAVISKGWSNLGNTEAPENVFFLDDCPHGWIQCFPTISICKC